MGATWVSSPVLNTLVTIRLKRIFKKEQSVGTDKTKVICEHWYNRYNYKIFYGAAEAADKTEGAVMRARQSKNRFTEEMWGHRNLEIG